LGVRRCGDDDDDSLGGYIATCRLRVHARKGVHSGCPPNIFFVA
jgi:hypothetical protein